MKLINLFSNIYNWIKNFLSSVLRVLIRVLTIINKPIERDRWLFGGSGSGMIILAIVIATIVPLVIWCAMEVQHYIEPSSEPSSDINKILLENYDTDVSSLSGFIKADSTIIIEADQQRVQHDHLWSVLSQYTDPGNLPAVQKGKGYFWALICAIAGIFCLSGFAVSSLVSFITRVSERWKKGLLHYNSFFSDYVVIIGVNEQTATIIKRCLKEPGVKYVLIQTRKDVEKERAKLDLQLERKEEEKIVFYYGERTLYEDITDLHVEKAKEVYILGENIGYENEKDHDSFNMTCLELISKYCESIHEEKCKKNWGGDSIKCHVELEYQSTFSAFKATHIYKSINEGKVEFIPFNVHEIWAKKVLVDNYAVYYKGKTKKIQHYLPLDTYKRENNEGKKKLFNLTEKEQKSAHLVIIGMNQMGVALAMQAALLIHLPNFTRDHRLRTTITFIDDNAVREGEYLMGRFSTLFALCRHRTIVCGKHTFNKVLSKSKEEYDVYEIPWIDENGKNCEWKNSKICGKYNHLGDNFMDIQWEFIEGNVASPDIKSYISALSEDTAHRTSTIAVCFNDPQQSIATALYLPEDVLKRAHQILVYQQNSFDLMDKIATSEKEWKRYEKLRPFGMIEGCYTEDFFDNNMAKLTHLVYLGKLTKGQTYKDRIKKEAELQWSEIGIDYKIANISLADSFSLKLRSAGNTWLEQKETLSDENRRKALSLAEHNRWVTERLSMGYRPLTSQEWHYIEDQRTANSNFDYNEEKRRLKNKKRAHVDICPGNQLYEKDPMACERNTDDTIVSMVPYLLNLEQRMIAHEILSRDQNDQSPSSFVLDMTKIDVNDEEDKVQIEKNEEENKEKPEFLHTFWIGNNLITRKQWKMVMGDLPPELHDMPQHEENKPITFVSKEMVDDFLIICNQITGLKFRLPWVEEWYYVEKNYREYKDNVNDLENKVWQWTQSQYQGTCYRFCGRSQQFYKEKWQGKDSYWIPTFKSSDLGFRLVLPYVFDRELKNDYDEDEAVIEDMLKESNMVFVKGGTIVLNGENNQFRVRMKNFRISRTPITQRQWNAVMGSGQNKSSHRGNDYPVEMVSYKDAILFTEKLSKLKKTNYRLPTDAEWQRAAEVSDAEQKPIWHEGNTKSTQRVSQGLEISDMLGNVWEWCNDNYAEYASFLDKDIVNDDQGGPEKGLVRVLRGGSWHFGKNWCTIDSQMRSYWLPDYVADDVGFRIAISEADYRNYSSSKDN